mgnify:CR=1 FL=1
MALKRRTKVNESFSMASMTDVIFLLLIFFMVTSTVVIPNAIKVTLPQAQKQTAAKPLTRVTGKTGVFRRDHPIPARQLCKRTGNVCSLVCRRDGPL